MKLTVYLTTGALLAGYALGTAWGRRDDSPEETAVTGDAGWAAPAATGPEAGTAPAAGVVGSRPVAAATFTTVEDVRPRLAALLEKKDGRGIRDLLRCLAGEGEGSFPALALVLEAVAATNGTEFGMGWLGWELMFESSCFRDFAAWGVRRRGELTTNLRLRLAMNLLEGDAGDDNRFVLSMLSEETDGPWCAALAGCMMPVVPEEVPGLIDAFQAHRHQPEVAMPLIGAFADCPSPEAIRFLRGLSAAPEEHLAVEARMALRVADPPVAGVLVWDRSCEADSPLQPGDIVVRWNGEDVTTYKRFRELRKAAEKGGGGVTIEVERNGVMESMTLTEVPSVWVRGVQPLKGTR